jgi:hypothetical protein
MSALGQKQTWTGSRTMSALPPKADITSGLSDVRFVPKADNAVRERAARQPKPAQAILLITRV